MKRDLSFESARQRVTRKLERAANAYKSGQDLLALPERMQHAARDSQINGWISEISRNLGGDAVTCCCIPPPVPASREQAFAEMLERSGKLPTSFLAALYEVVHTAFRCRWTIEITHDLAMPKGRSVSYTCACRPHPKRNEWQNMLLGTHEMRTPGGVKFKVTFVNSDRR